MFICSVRASSVRFFAAIFLTLALLICALAFGGADAVSAMSDGTGDYSFSGVRDEAGRLSFLSQFGVEVKSTPVEEETFAVPENFDRVMMGYNEIQKAQGLDISKYEKKKVTRYTYEVTNADYDGTVYANIIVYRGHVIACDVSTADPRGFVKPLTDFAALREQTE